MTRVLVPQDVTPYLTPPRYEDSFDSTIVSDNYILLIINFNFLPASEVPLPRRGRTSLQHCLCA
jgi:hypothetical protein